MHIIYLNSLTKCYNARGFIKIIADRFELAALLKSPLNFYYANSRMWIDCLVFI